MKLPYYLLPVIFATFPVSPQDIQANNTDPVKESRKEEPGVYVIFPKSFPSFDFHFSVGMSMSELPQKIVEDVFDQIPMLDVKSRFQLPYNIGITADFNTNVFTNLLRFGPNYSFTSDKFSAGLGSDFLVWYGFYNSSDFDISVFGWGYSPYILAGYDFEDFYITIRADIKIKAQNTYMRKVEYTKNSPKYSGVSLSAAVEQPLWGNNYFVIGFSGHYTKFFYKSWISFSTFDEYLFYPEFFAGFIF